jgi:hypothetical protein
LYNFFSTDLCPINGCPEEKYNLNAYTSGIGFRSSRLNHSCNPNVQIWVVEGTHVMVFYSNGPIKRRDELLIDYVSIWVHHSESKESLQCSMHKISLDLIFRWAIFCPSDCICKDPNILLVVAEFSRLAKISYKSGSEGDFKTSLAASKKRLQLCNTGQSLIGNLEAKCHTLYDAFGAAVLLRDKISAKEAIHFIKEHNEIIAQLEFPSSVKSLRYKTFTDDLQISKSIISRFCKLNAEW